MESSTQKIDRATIDWRPKSKLQHQFISLCLLRFLVKCGRSEGINDSKMMVFIWNLENQDRTFDWGKRTRFEDIATFIYKTNKVRSLKRRNKRYLTLKRWGSQGEKPEKFVSLLTKFFAIKWPWG